LSERGGAIQLGLRLNRRPFYNREAPGLSREAPVPLDIGQLFSRYHQRVALWVRLLGGPRIEVEDAVQEVFLVAQRRLRRLEREEELITWLRRVTENVVRDQRRRWRRDEQAVDVSAGFDRVADSTPLQPDLIARREAMYRVYAALDKMSDRYRTVFILFEIEELSGQEISAIKGIKLGTVWVWLHRARVEFFQRLAELGRQST
jgi:RNA polymerase sigma-70 factor (ECF subfamily)